MVPGPPSRAPSAQPPSRGPSAEPLGVLSVARNPGLARISTIFAATTLAGGLAMMFDRVSPSSYDTVSALWNLAFDVGYGVGGAGFCVLALETGYPPAFAITAALMAIALCLWKRS